ncbi:MAG: dicarboxylate/amino acid:cation symporter [Tissierellia bacterium]|nr:dicarboxylate/amino acid:cation symporter [Tissierellia bacterium]
MTEKRNKKTFALTTKIFIGLILGVIVGLLMQNHADFATSYIKPLGTLFLNLIKLIIVPLVFSSLLVGVADLDDVTKLGKIGLKTIAFFLITTAVAIIIGLALANIGNVGGNFVLPAEQITVETKEAPSIIDTLLNTVPANPLEALVEGRMLQIIVFAIIMGAGLLAVNEKAVVVFDFFRGITEAMYVIIAGVMKFAPIGVFGLIVPVIAENGPEVLLPLLRLIIIVYAACLIHMGLVYTFAVKISNYPIKKFYKAVFKPWLIAFTTSSSSGTLPITIQTAEEDLGVPKPIASFVLPLGATINMDGTSIYQGVCALFIAQVYGISLTIGQQLTIVLTATLASIGAAGVPGAGMIMLGMVLESVGLPIEGIALVAGVDRLLDMMRTSVNVVGDIACSIFVSRTEGELDHIK